jgi:hypothetical protein
MAFMDTCSNSLNIGPFSDYSTSSQQFGCLVDAPRKLVRESNAGELSLDRC